MLAYNAIKSLQKVDVILCLVPQFSDKRLHPRGMFYGRSSLDIGTITVLSTISPPWRADRSDLQTPRWTNAPDTVARPSLKINLVSNMSCV
jgi:hypothetical protein